ncbi:MAG: glycosyltransferase [Firmicutes bacterium]|nr:glycosyltransferase [Bacillota bacterium]
MNILMVVTSPEIGGTETHILYLARELRRRGHHTGVATAGGPFVPYFDENQIPVHRVEKLGEDHRERSAAKIASIVRSYDYDVVHVHDKDSLRLAPYLRTLCPQVGIVLTVHGKYMGSKVKHLYAATDHVIAVSPALKQWIQDAGVPAGRTSCIQNGVDTTAFAPVLHRTPYRRLLGLPRTGPLALYVGRFQSDKLPIARKCLTAGERVARTRPNFHMLLIGFGEYGRELSRDARSANERLGRNALLVREATVNIAPFYHASTLVIGTGRVAMEALSCARPVIAAGCAGYDGIVSERSIATQSDHHFGDHRARSSLHSSRIASDVAVLLNQRTYRKSLERAGRAVALERFSISQTGAQTLALYEEILAAKDKATPPLEDARAEGEDRG